MRFSQELWQEVKHFTASEFASPDMPGSGDNMSPRLVFILDCWLRPSLGKPLTINSGFRTVEHNKAVGGAPSSAHLDGMAVDISRKGLTVEEVMWIVKNTRKFGINGIGVAKTFVHLDIKPRVASWAYVPGGTRRIPLGQEWQHV